MIKKQLVNVPKTEHLFSRKGVVYFDFFAKNQNKPFLEF
jgi:hypothetical protein